MSNCGGRVSLGGLGHGLLSRSKFSDFRTNLERPSTRDPASPPFRSSGAHGMLRLSNPHASGAVRSLRVHKQKICVRLRRFFVCGPERIRTADLPLAKRLLYQLSYGPGRERLPEQGSHSKRKAARLSAYPRRTVRSSTCPTSCFKSAPTATRLRQTAEPGATDGTAFASTT